MKSGEHAKILIVEDEGIVAHHLASSLLRAGYEVAGIADSADEAVRHVQEHTPELILMDIRIKGLTDGIDTAKLLRKRYNVPIIYLTAHSDKETVDRAKMTGASGFLTKPVQLAALGHAIEMALNNRRGEQEAGSQRAWMRTVLDRIPEGVIVVDGQRAIQFMNSAAETLTGWNDEAARGVNAGVILPAETWQQSLGAEGSLLGDPGGQLPQRLPSGLSASRNSGQWFPIEGEISPSVDGERVVGAVVQFTDAAARRVAELELRHDQKLKAVGRAAAAVAHDFNNLVFIILGYTDELIERMTPGVPAPDALTKIRRAGRSAAKLAEQLLDFSRKDVPEKIDINLNEVIRGNEDLVRRLGGRRVEWEFDLEPELQAVRAEEGQIQQVLTNLVTNARDAMPLGGMVTVTTANPGSRGSCCSPGFVEIRVADTGVGMSAETTQRLFEPFFTTKKPGKGTGLGLAIVQNIVEDLGGTIRVESEIDEGSVFTIHLPAIAGIAGKTRQELRACEECAMEKSTGSGGTATVLLIEDEPGIRHLVRDYLTDSGYAVLEAGSGEEGIQSARAHDGRIDLLITDVVMPNASGFEVARELAELQPGIKTLFMSGYGADSMDSGGTNAEPPVSARFLLKPFVRTELLENVRSLLGRGATLIAGR